MKIDIVKLLIAFAICALLGFLCYIAAPDLDGRKWISFATATISLFICLAPAMSMKFESAGNRSVSGKLVGWIFFVILLIENFAFSFNTYAVTTHIAVTTLIALIGLAIFYSISKS